MPQVVWTLHHDRPIVELLLTPTSAPPQVRYLVADTGAGNAQSGFELLLQESDCLQCGGLLAHSVTLGGAFVGAFQVYVLRVQIPKLAYDGHVRAVALPTCPAGIDGIAGFRFLNQFTYGNIGDFDKFGLEL